MSKAKRFEYQPTFMYDNCVEEFVCAGSYQIENYIRSFQTIQPDSFDDMYIIMSEAHEIKKALKILTNDEFYDDSRIPFEMYFCSVVKAKKLIELIDEVVSEVLCDYFTDVVMNKLNNGKWI